MTRLNRKVEYALMALKHMSSKFPGQLTTAKEICEVTGGPFDATARVMQVMAHKGLLKSEQGAHGGYLLVKDLSKVSFYELMEMILGPMEIVKCIHASEECELHSSCNIQSPLSQLNSRLMEFYSQLPLNDLLQVKDKTVLKA